MEFKFAPLSNFIQYSDRSPLTRDEYQAKIHPGPRGGAPISNSTAGVSTQSGREALVNKISSQFRLGGASPLLGSLVPSGSLGMGGGLYSGVGQLQAHQVKSLISAYV